MDYEEASIRPQRFSDFIGQTQVKANLETAVRAARGRCEVLDHVLLTGQPGLGKSSLARILANDQVESKILHRGIENLFQTRL